MTTTYSVSEQGFSPDIFGINRYESAQQILETPRAIKKVDANTYAVKSQGGISVYTVKIGDRVTCTCPDHLLNHVDCKHILAVKELLNQPTKIRKCKPENYKYPLYNLAQCSEGEFVRIALKELLRTKDFTKATHRGRPTIPMEEQIFSAVMKVYGQKSLRRSQYEMKECVAKDYLTKEHHFNTVSKFLNNPKVTPILHDLIRFSALPMIEIENSFSIDSSGFTTSSFSDWCDKKHRTKLGRRERNWIRCHIACGNLTNVVTDAIITEREGDDTGDETQFAELLDNTCGFFHVREICGDKAYASEENYAKAEEYGIDAYLLFKKNAKQFGHGNLWAEMYGKMVSHLQDYRKHYGKRNNVESTFNAIKRKFGEKLYSQNFVSQQNELLCKILGYNLTVLCNAFFLFDVEPDFDVWENLDD